MAKLDQEKDIQEGPAHQNPLKTAYGGMKDAKTLLLCRHTMPN